MFKSSRNQEEKEHIYLIFFFPLVGLLLYYFPLQVNGDFKETSVIIMRELAEWFIAVSLKLIWFKKPHPFESDILCKY